MFVVCFEDVICALLVCASYSLELTLGEPQQFSKKTDKVCYRNVDIILRTSLKLSLGSRHLPAELVFETHYLS